MRWMQQSSERPEWTEVSPENQVIKNFWMQWDRLQVRDGVLLYRRWESEKGDQITWQMVIPKSLKEKVLRNLHATKTAGHLGVKKTEARIRERFYWPGYRTDVQEWCRVCDHCASKKGPHRTPRAPMQIFNVGTPMERVAVDKTGPLTETYEGNRYILVICDYFTKWTEAYALPNQEATTVAGIRVEQFFCRFGCATQIHSDQGRNFESEIFQEVCRLLEMDKTRTTALHPQSDGLVERFNRTLKTMLSLFVEERQRDWDQHLPYLMMAYRSAVHESTGYSPNELMLGRRTQLPIDLMLGRNYTKEEEEAFHLLPTFVQEMQERIDNVHQFARANIRMVSERQKKHYDRKVAVKPYKRSDAVWLHNPTRKKGLSPKLQRPWEGPYTILDRISEVTYRIQRTPRTKRKVVHNNRLKPYVGQNAPNWLKNKTSDQIDTEEVDQEYDVNVDLITIEE